MSTLYSSIKTRHHGDSPSTRKFMFGMLPCHLVLSFLFYTATWVCGMFVMVKTNPQYLLEANKDSYGQFPPLLEQQALNPQQMQRLLSAAQQQQQSALQEPSKLFAFVIRDAKRLVPVEPLAPGMHIYDYVDVYHSTQTEGKAHLYLDGMYIDQPPACQDYSLECYRNKLLQVFQHVLDTTAYDYYFYMEADNMLCVSLSEIESLALRHRRYFIGTGIGASGWIMSRQFVMDFLNQYKQLKEKEDNTNDQDNNKKKSERGAMPDAVAADMMMKQKTWSVTSRYLVSHTILPSMGSEALTTAGIGEPEGDKKRPPKKHLPRCLEPHRGIWGSGKRDNFGWDYFDFERCNGYEVFPCNNVTTLAFPPRPIRRRRRPQRPPASAVREKTNQEFLQKLKAREDKPKAAATTNDSDFSKYFPNKS